MTSTTPEDKGKGLVCVASIRERVHIVQCMFIDDSVRPINEPITFLSIDSNWVILLHKDALILTLRVNNFDVRKILVDPRSSVDLLQMSTYRQMWYSPSSLENLSRIFIRINRASTISLGDVILLVQVGLITLNV